MLVATCIPLVPIFFWLSGINRLYVLPKRITILLGRGHHVLPKHQNSLELEAAYHFRHCTYIRGYIDTCIVHIHVVFNTHV